MNKSESIGALAGSLSRVQSEIKDAFKDKKGYGYHYADLSQILDISRTTLSRHKMAVTQLCGAASDKVTVETVLMHESGEWVSSLIEMAVEAGKGMSKAQAVGSVITYARRYALAAIIGIAQSDNDASLMPEVPISRPDPHQVLASMLSSKPKEEVSRWLAREGVEDMQHLPLDKVMKAIDKIKQRESH